MIALVDCNNFYVSCERVFNPIIRNKPVVVLSNNDGCIIARSDKAKALGIQMGAPTFKYRHLFKKYGIYVFSANLTLYGDISNRVMSLLADSAPFIEIYSIDEAFIDYSELDEVIGYSQNLRRKVSKWTGIPVSIGIAKTKTLAKVANGIAKQEVNSGVFHLHCRHDIQEHLKQLPISNLWGVGRQYANKLKCHNVRTAYDLTQCRDSWIKRQMTIRGLQMVKELRGINCFSIEKQWKRKQSISTSRTFGNELRNFNQLAQAISTYATICSVKLRKQKGCAAIITIFISTNPFKNKYCTTYKGTKSIRLKTPTNDSLKIVSTSIIALRSIYRNDCVYKKAGVIVSAITPQSNVQLDFFDNIIDIEKRNSLMRAVDSVNNQYGRMKLHLAINGFKHSWNLDRERLSPCYTTNMNDLLKVDI